MAEFKECKHVENPLQAFIASRPKRQPLEKPAGKPRKPITPESLAASGTEDGEQQALFCHAAFMERADWRWGLLFAIPNGGKRGIATAARLKATGVKRGVPDVCLPVVKNGYYSGGKLPRIKFIKFPGLYVELKTLGSETKPPGKLAEAQNYWRDVLRNQGYKVETAYGWKQAANIIAEYLNECKI